MTSGRPVIYKTEEEKKAHYEERKAYNRMMVIKAVKKYKKRQYELRNKYLLENEEYVKLINKREQLTQQLNDLIKVRDEKRKDVMTYCYAVANKNKELTQLVSKITQMGKELRQEYMTNKKAKKQSLKDGANEEK